jgi:hypothetical protein
VTSARTGDGFTIMTWLELCRDPARHAAPIGPSIDDPVFSYMTSLIHDVAAAGSRRAAGLYKVLNRDVPGGAVLLI